MTPRRLAFLVPAVLLAALIVWALSRASFGASFAAIASDPWGVVTLVDLYCAFIVAGFVIWRFEASRPLAVALIAATLVLGSLVPLVWLAVRAGDVLIEGRRTGT